MTQILLIDIKDWEIKLNQNYQQKRPHTTKVNLQRNKKNEKYKKLNSKFGRRYRSSFDVLTQQKILLFVKLSMLRNICNMFIWLPQRTQY